MIHSIHVKLQRQDAFVWKLGPGPCGRDVWCLRFTVAEGVIQIEQFCKDSDDPDVFVYPLHNVEHARAYQTPNPSPSKG